jgi:hypothetical protein
MRQVLARAVAWGLIDVNRGVLRAPKDVGERVALRIDFVAAVRGKGLANHTPIAFSARAGSTDEFDPRHESDPMTDPR